MTSNAGNPGPPSAAVTGNHVAPMTTLLTEQETAALLKVTKKTLQGWRYRGVELPFLKVGRCVRYRLEDLQAFVKQAVRRSTSDPAALPGKPGIRIERFLEKTGRALGRGATVASPPGKPR